MAGGAMPDGRILRLPITENRAVPRGWAIALSALIAASVVVAGRASAAGIPASAAEARLAERFASRGLPFPPRAVTLIALKSEARLELWAERDGGWTFVRSYLVRGASGRLGPKLRQGDHQVPEGIYRVRALNPSSRYHLALGLDYPNAFDRARGREDGRTRVGGDVMIHGGRASDGCVPVGDDAIEELFALAARIGVENVSVIISPVDLRRVDAATALARTPVRPPWLPDLHAELAHRLREFPLPAESDGAGARIGAVRKGDGGCTAYDAVDCSRRCEAGDAASCARAGILYAGGRGVAADPDRAWTLLARSCSSGDPLGCGALSALVLGDDGLRRDAERAASLARAACDGGDGHGCARLAELCNERLFYPGAPHECAKENVMRLRERAVAALDSSCKGWAAFDCYALAAIYGPGDRATAFRFAEGSCAAGDPGGCDLLGALYESDGREDRARSVSVRACDAGYARSCARLGDTIDGAGFVSRTAGGPTRASSVDGAAMAGRRLP
jgi:TPR repeat protein